jgi:tungstate transport system substrate-binding protein
MNVRQWIKAISCIALLFFLRSSRLAAEEHLSPELRVIFPVTCVAPGLAVALADSFAAQYKIPTKIYSLCTGDAIRFIKEHIGIEEVDVMLGHEPDAEEQFVKDGFAVNLRPVCYSDFVLVGPAEDPAKVKGMKNVLKALEKIASVKAPFCSRGDSSGTHGLELRLWKAARIKPAGDWYITTKTGTESTLLIAAKKRAYFICQWAAFASMTETVDLAPLVEDTERLFTDYDVMAMNPEKFPKANYIQAMTFIGFLTAPATQKFIGEFGREKFKRQSFIPLAIKPNQPRKGN